MSVNPGGYSLEQLLAWCSEDDLIDGFERDGDFVVIFLSGLERRMSHTDARVYLARLFTGMQQQGGTGDDRAEA